MSRISIEKKEYGTLIKIKAYYEEGKQKMLNLWLFAWTLCGLAIISQVFLDANGELKNMILIFGAFWAYFEYMVVKAFKWRRTGEEQIFITKDAVQYGRTYNNRGVLKPYRLDQMNAVREMKDESNSFVRSFMDSYWVIGGEKLAFSYQAKIIPFGLRLSEKESKKVTQQINKLIGE